eukprot:9035108-Alexandrium_andersonii.AAC.1
MSESVASTCLRMEVVASVSSEWIHAGCKLQLATGITGFAFASLLDQLPTRPTTQHAAFARCSSQAQASRHAVSAAALATLACP